MIAPRMWNWNVWPKRKLVAPPPVIKTKDDYDTMRDALVAVLVSHERGYSRLSAGAMAVVKKALIGRDR